jgi:hypothetical protein
MTLKILLFKIDFLSLLILPSKGLLKIKEKREQKRKK